ncbi:MAG TPA: M24 family metallopeptidase [Pyrinomonadaceae bacterium]
MSSRELQEKTERLMKMLAAENLGGVLLNSQPNFAWLTGGANNGVDGSRENGAASLFIRSDGKRFVLASRIEMPRILAEEISAGDFEPIEFGWEDEKASANFLTNRVFDLLTEDKNFGSDIAFGADVRTIESAIARCRYQLTETEIERYRQLGKDAGTIIGNLAKTLAPGQTELEIARLASEALAQKNIRSVVTLVAADERLEKFRHPVPTHKKWEKTVMIVVCARREGLIASLSRIVCAGKASEGLKQKTQACAEVNAQILAATKPGETGAQLYKTAAAAYERVGFAGEINSHHQGGATGYRTRDWVAHPSSTEVVGSDQAFAWNPSISGTKIEETLVCRDNSIEVLTASPDWAQISVEINGREYLSSSVLSV